MSAATRRTTNSANSTKGTASFVGFVEFVVPFAALHSFPSLSSSQVCA